MKKKKQTMNTLEHSEYKMVNNGLKLKFKEVV